MRTAMAIMAALLLAGCTERTELGECYGLLNDEQKQDDLNYRTDTFNVIMGVVFFETAIVPVIVFGYETKCPTSRKVVRR